MSDTRTRSDLGEADHNHNQLPYPSFPLLIEKRPHQGYCFGMQCQPLDLQYRGKFVPIGFGEAQEIVVPSKRQCWHVTGCRCAEFGRTRIRKRLKRLAVKEVPTVLFQNCQPKKNKTGRKSRLRLEFSHQIELKI